MFGFELLPQDVANALKERADVLRNAENSETPEADRILVREYEALAEIIHPTPKFCGPNGCS